jgi:hypothetical protein
MVGYSTSLGLAPIYFKIRPLWPIPQPEVMSPEAPVEDVESMVHIARQAMLDARGLPKARSWADQDRCVPYSMRSSPTRGDRGKRRS